MIDENRHLADNATLNKHTAKYRVRHLRESCQSSSTTRYFATTTHSPCQQTGAGTPPLSATLQTFKRATSKQLHSSRSPSPLPQDYICGNQQWQAAVTHIQSLADTDAADQIFTQCGNVWSHTMTFL